MLALASSFGFIVQVALALGDKNLGRWIEYSADPLRNVLMQYYLSERLDEKKAGLPMPPSLEDRRLFRILDAVEAMAYACLPEAAQVQVMASEPGRRTAKLLCFRLCSINCQDATTRSSWQPS